MRIPEQPKASFVESAQSFNDQNLVRVANDAYEVVSRLSSRWKWRRRLPTQWPLVPLATYALALEDELEARGFTSRRPRIVRKVARVSNLSEGTVEGFMYQDVLEAMGSMPEVYDQGWEES